MSLLLSMIGSYAGASTPARANDGVALLFDVLAQPLQNALEAFGAASGFSGFYSAASTDGRISTPVQGRYSADAALRLLIGNAALVVRYTAPDAFILEPDAVARPAASTTVSAQSAYFGMVQSRVRDAICGDSRLSQGDYRLAMLFRIDVHGQVVQPALLSSTGNGARERAVIETLHALQIGSAPADPSQPYTMLILPGTLRAACAT